MNSFPRKLTHWLFDRRSRHRMWAYLVWLLVYLPTAAMFMDDIDLRASQAWPLLIPVAVVVIQIIRPTMSGWLVILLPSVLYTGIGVFYLIRNATQNPPQWQYDSEGFILGSFMIGAFIGLCIALIFARPRTSL